MAPPVLRNEAVSKRKSSIKACLRCHRRKQRCIGFPSCANCQAVHEPCHRDSNPITRKLAGLSKEELMNRIVSLEHHATVSHRENPQSPHQSPLDGFSVGPPTPTHRLQDEGNGDLALDATANRGFPASNIAQVQPQADPNQSLDGVLCQRPSGASVTFTGFAQASLPETPLGVTNPGEDILAHLPGERLGSDLLTNYLESLHRRLPFCNFTQLLLQHRELHQASSTIPSTADMNTFRLYMAYAIGASVLQLTGTSLPLQPEDYLARATNLTKSLNRSPVQDAEIVFWKALYKLRASFNSDVWYMVGLAMRTAIEAGLHREYHYRTLDRREAQLQRRLFWALYAVERNICWSLKRPFSIADHDIDVALPTADVESTILDEDPFTLTSSATASTGPRRPLDLGIFRATIELSRINSRNYSELYRVDRDPTLPQGRVTELLEQLRHFEASLPACSNSDQDFLQLHVRNAERILIEPFLSSMHPSDPLLRVCLEAAGSVCQVFKRLRLKRSLGYSFTMVNSVFVAGTTICYIIFKSPELWTPTRANDIRSCSSTLFAAAERNCAVRKYCDVLENIINATMDHIEQVMSPGQTSPLASTSYRSDSDSGSPAETFSRLKVTMKELQFEFPSRSYPAYHEESTLTPKNSLPRSQADAVLDIDNETGSVPPFTIDFTFPDATWDSMGPFGDIINMNSNSSFLNANTFH